MRFKNAKVALNWYAHRKCNPLGEISITEACIQVIKGKIGSGPGYNPLEDGKEDALIAMCDLGEMLDKFPPFLATMLVIWAVDGEKKDALKYGSRVNYIFRRKRRSQQYNILNSAIHKITRMLLVGEYLKERPPKVGKKISVRAENGRVKYL